MIRTQIQVSPEQYQQLRDAAHRQNRSVADCIREGIRLFLGRQQGAVTRLDEISGRFRPIPADDLSPHDRWFAATALDSKDKASAP